jgi:hypothetical protein
VKRHLLAMLCSAAALSSAPANAQFSIGTYTPISPVWITPVITWKCTRGDGTSCSRSDLANPWYRQIVILPTGYTDAERNTFWTDFDKIRQGMSNAGSAWSTQKRNQLLYVGYFVAGGALNTATSTFGGKVAAHPVRGYALSASSDAVSQKIAAIASADIPELKPMGVAVLFNTLQDGIAANATTPTLLRRSYGIARFTRADLDTPYVATHELAHAALNFVDEYVEPGLEEMNIRQLDALTPLLLFDGTWGGFVAAISDMFKVYDYNISEILAGNGNHNVSLSRYPATVYTPGYVQPTYAYEGGMTFGRGVFHMAGNNLMNGSHVMRGTDDGFAYAHTASQQQVIEAAFGAGAQRPNDRLRTAGPKNGWPLEYGSTTTVMMYDGDKLNHFQPTQKYTVEVGWYERNWKTCWDYAFIPYPCYDNIWTTVQKDVYPSERRVDLRLTTLYGLASLVQSTFCSLGVTEIPKPDGGVFKMCESDLTTVASAFLPTPSLRTPYQSTTVPASQWQTTYYWRFKTWNGAIHSGWTGWSSFYRSL